MDFDINRIRKHYVNNWENIPIIKTWDKGPMQKIDDSAFHILEFTPTKEREMWTYATCGMSFGKDAQNLKELHIFSPRKDDSLVELLTGVAYYHRTTKNLDLWHTINFGRPWQDNSLCEYGLISLPYLDGPKLENMYVPEYDENMKFYWLIPITEDEVDFKSRMGVESLEEKFEEKNLDYVNPKRKSVLA